MRCKDVLIKVHFKTFLKFCYHFVKGTKAPVQFLLTKGKHPVPSSHELSTLTKSLKYRANLNIERIEKAPWLQRSSNKKCL